MRSTHIIPEPGGIEALHRKHRILRGRGAKVGVGMVLAFLLLLVPVADASLGPFDTATGTGALANESSGNYNTADGYYALNANTAGFFNTAVGAQALNDNTYGYDNTAIGLWALLHNTSGGENTAAGVQALLTNTAGVDNTAAGNNALVRNTTGDDNTAVGSSALEQNETGDRNTAVGRSAGEVTPDGPTTGSQNTFLGYQAHPGSATLGNATAIGADAMVDESNALVLGADGVRVGVGTTAPRSLLQVGVPSTSYGDYLQIPMVTSNSGPPARACLPADAGRLVLQYDAQKVRTTLWSCSAAGVWTKLAQGG